MRRSKFRSQFLGPVAALRGCQSWQQPAFSRLLRTWLAPPERRLQAGLSARPSLAGATDPAAPVFQDFAHLLGERTRCEWLLQERYFLLQDAVVDHRSIRVARHVQDFHVAAPLVQARRQIAAVD